MTPLLFLIGLLLSAQNAVAADCPRGTLDSQYCDRDDDMIADAPTAAKDFSDPDTLIFSYTPLEDPSVYPAIWQSFLDHLQNTTGKKVRMFLVQTNAAQLEAMRSGRLHVAGINTGSIPIAVNCAGAVPFAMMSGPLGPFGYQMEIIVPVNSAIKAPADLKGRSIAFTAPTSNSGYKAPAYILQTEFGLKADADYKSLFSGRHENSILGVVHGDYDAAAIANSVTKFMARRGTYDPRAIRSIYKSGTFPTTGYAYAHDLKPELAAKIREAFFTYNIAADTRMTTEFDGQDKFMPIAYKTDWEIVRKIDAGTGVKYDCK